MFTLVLYTALCFSSTDCHEFEPMIWTSNSVAELNKDLEACAKEERRYATNVAGTYKESDCYIVENK